MKNYIKYIVVGLVCLLVGGYVGTHYLGSKAQLAGASPTGATFSSAKLPAIVMNLTSSTGTSSSILNTTGNDQYITALKVGCEVVGTSLTAYTGTGLSKLTLSFATSSTASPTSNGNANVIGSSAMTVSTSTAQFTEASSTASNGSTSPGSSLVSNIWGAGTYLTITANATNTAQCTVGVDTLSS